MGDRVLRPSLASRVKPIAVDAIDPGLPDRSRLAQLRMVGDFKAVSPLVLIGCSDSKQDLRTARSANCSALQAWARPVC